MSIRVYDTVSGSTFIFPMEPEKIKFSAATKFIEYELIQLGDVAIPLGEELNNITWDGVLPGAKRKDQKYVHNWKKPSEIQETWSVWRYKGRKLRLTIDGTPINHGVYLKSYDMEYSGGMGDYAYNIAFIAAKEIDIKFEQKKETAVEEDTKVEEEEKVYVIVTATDVNVRTQPSTSGKIIFVANKGDKFEYAGKKSGNWYYIVTDKGKLWISSRYSKLSTDTTSSKPSYGSASSSGASDWKQLGVSSFGIAADLAETASSKPSTYKVKSGDTLWSIALRFYKDGSQYAKIQSANGLSGGTIIIGQTLIIP